jgi:hypothetical protein
MRDREEKRVTYFIFHTQIRLKDNEISLIGKYTSFTLDI